MKWFLLLPLLIRIPLLAAVMIFGISMLVTQISVLSLSRQYELLTERVGQVYLDGLSALVLPAYQVNDSEGINRALRQSLDFYLGVVDRQLALIDRDNGVVAHVSGPNLSAPTPPPLDLLQTTKGYTYEEKTSSLWVWRELGSRGVIAANLDMSAFAQERRLLHFHLILISALLSILAALGGYLVIRKLQQPLKILSEHLSQAVAFGPKQIDETDIPKNDVETAALIRTYNRMTTAMQDREQLLEQMAKQDQQALLGRIAATLAHEIHNPLTGIMTAIQTIRMYGNNTRSRNEALDFIDRGIQSLQGVAEATLRAYRPSAPGPDLQNLDLYDVLRLAEPHAARNQVRISKDIPLFLPLRLDAFKVRQIALNLLLNAIQTSPPNGTVGLVVVVESNVFSLKVSDEGEGMPRQARDFLLGNVAARHDGSLGLDIIRRLVKELNGEIHVNTQVSGGSTITLIFPVLEDGST